MFLASPWIPHIGMRLRDLRPHKRRCHCRQIIDSEPSTPLVHPAFMLRLFGWEPCRAVLSEGKTAMADYRCYLVNNLDQIQSATDFECAEDSEAMLQAGALAQSQSLT